MGGLVVEIPHAAVTWMRSGERGLSSEAIFDHMTGLSIGDRWSRGRAPADPADVRRCRLLLEAVPEFAHRFGEMERYPAWESLVKNWVRLCILMDSEAPGWRNGEGNCPKTYKLMRELEVARGPQGRSAR